MSPLGFLWLLFLQHTGAALGYVLFTHSARRGSNTTIPCKFDVNAVPPAQRTFSVIWHFQEKEIFRYPNNPEVLNSRLSIDQDRIKDGTADLYMSGVSISDGGLYKCSMTQIPGEKEKEIRLDVYAPPRITITGKNIIISKENVLSCAISGFYPVDIDIKWLRDGIILNNITLEKPQRDPDGMYSVRSSVTIIPTKEDRKRIFSCRIQHESLTTPLQEDFKLLYGDTKSSTLYTIIIPVIAGVVILILIAAVAIFCVERKGKKNHNKVKNRENQEEKLMPSNQQGQNKHHEDNLENQKENLLANNPPEDHLPKKPQDREKNVKSVREKSNNRDKSLINNEPSQAALPSPDHRLTGISHPSSEGQESCSERSGTQQAPVYSAVRPTPVYPTSHTGLKTATAATQSNSHITSPQGTKGLRPSIDKQTGDSGRGQAAQQQEIDHRLTGNSYPLLERQESCSEGSGSPVYNAVPPASVHPTSHTGLEPGTAPTQSNSHITSPQGTKDLRPTIDMQTRDSGRGQAAQQQEIAHRLSGNSHPSSERQESCSERSGIQQAPAHNAVLPAPVHPTSHTGLEPATAATQSNSHITSPQGTKDLRPTIDMPTGDSGRGQAAQEHKIADRLTGNIHPSSERQESCSEGPETQQAPVYSTVCPTPVHHTSDTGLEPVTAVTQDHRPTGNSHPSSGRQESYTERSGTQQAPAQNPVPPTPVHHTSATKDLRQSLDMQTRTSDRGQEKQQNNFDHRLTGNIHPFSKGQESYTERSGTQQAPAYNAFHPKPVHHTSATKDLRQSLDMQTRDSGRGQEKQHHNFDHRPTGNSHPSSERQKSYTERSGTQQAPVYNAFRPPPVHHTSATKDLIQSLNMQTRASGRGQAKQQHEIDHRLTGNSHLFSERQESYTDRSGTQQAPAYNAFRPMPVHHTSATKDLRQSLDMQTRDSGRGQEKQQHMFGNQGGVNSAKSATKNWSRDSMSPVCQKTTSQASAVPPEPRVTRKKTEPSNQEIPEIILGTVADLRKQFGAQK